jgi:UDP-N-acetylglucosamine--N-acetylmuramyl-(pentapeptide) pyrophosphoryl-undecaprenol N-acetylglucosamine transferase
MNKNKNIIIATGGTGGHIFPAVSLANYLINNGFIVKLTTDQRGIKYFDSKFIKFSKIINSSTFSNNKKLFSVIKILIAIFSSFIFVLKIKPKFILGMGGYASFPLCFVAIILRIPFIIYENNLLIGKANRYLAPFAKKIFVSYEDVQGIKSKYKKKTVVIGNILRENILNFSETIKDKNFDYLNILVLGGSQAAKIFAEILPDIFVNCGKNNLNLKIYQQCLDDQKILLQKKYDENNINCELFSFTFDILKYYNLSHLVITRAGSSALAELINCKIPFISIPLKTSSENHQFKNAEYFAKKGFGFMIEEKNIENKLFDLLQSIHKDKSILNLIKKKQNKHCDKNVFVIIKNEITKMFYEN